MTSSPSLRRMPRTPVEDARLELADVGRLEADRLAVAGREQDVIVLGQQLDADQAVGGIAFLAIVAVLAVADRELHGDLAGGRHVGEGVHRVAPDRAVGGGEHDVQAAPFLLILGKRQDGGDGFALRQRQQVDHRPALGVGAALGQAPDLHAVDAAEVGEEQHRIVGRGDEQLGDRILVLGRHARAALAAALLLAEQGQRRALDVAGHGHRHDHVLDLDQVLVLEPVEGGGDLATCAGWRIRPRPRRILRASPRRAGRDWRGSRAAR